MIKGLQPKTFVAENVSGLIKGSAKGYFKLILKGLKDCGYEVKVKLLNAKYLGVPQSRERVIFVGVRNDIAKKYNVHPVHPTPKTHIIPLKDAIGDIVNDEAEVKELLHYAEKYSFGRVLRMLPKNPPKPVQGSSVMNGSYFSLRRESMYRPCGTVCQTNGQVGMGGNCHPLEDRKFTIAELRRITSVPDDFQTTGTFPQQWERLGRMVPPVMMMYIAKEIQKEILDHVK